MPPVFTLNEGVSGGRAASGSTRSPRSARLSAPGGLRRDDLPEVQVDFPGALPRRRTCADRCRGRTPRAVLGRRAGAARGRSSAAGIIDLRAHREEIQNAGSIELWRIAREPGADRGGARSTVLAAADDVPAPGRAAPWSSRATTASAAPMLALSTLRRRERLLRRGEHRPAPGRARGRGGARHGQARPRPGPRAQG